MLTRLYLDNCFTHQDQTFLFEKGLTGIIGPNESGKSLIVEMIRYALFGSKALRGKSEDYKKLHVELDFLLLGTPHTVIRKPNEVKLYVDGDTLVSGTKPVDAAIKNVLGYDLTVFDVANSCNQGSVEALSQMTPGARKAMVDQTIGLNALDDLIKFCGQEGNAVKREADAFMLGVLEPVPAVQPEGYQPSEGIPLAQQELLAAEFTRLGGELANAPVKPKKPKSCPIKKTSVELGDLQDERNVVQRELMALQGQLRVIPLEVHSAKDLDEFEAWMDKAEAWDQKQKLLQQGFHKCPSCNHEWSVADLGDLEKVEETTAPSMTRRELREHRTNIGNNIQREELEGKIAFLEGRLIKKPDLVDDLLLRREYEAELEAYEASLVVYQNYNKGLKAKTDRYDELVGAPELVVIMREQHRIALQYEQLRETYQALRTQYKARKAQAEEMKKTSREFFKAREVIQALKVSVKNHLLPALNSVASAVLSQMTGGTRYKVEIDEEFEILIDDQPIGTLSGSGVAVANLAIRIALGCILTNRVFSLFMADEVDASMDSERAAYTAEALRRLADSVSQVILVTHKTPETDHTLELQP